MGPPPWSPQTRLLALLGHPVAHSLSPRIQEAAFRAAGVDGVYLALQVTEAGLPGLLRGIALAGGGGNVTLPHKEAAARVVDHLEPDALATGAVNTFWKGPSGIHGDNTDVEGLRLALEELLPEGLGGAPVLLLGAGGAARAAILALSRAGAGPLGVLNRTRERAEALVEAMLPHHPGLYLATEASGGTPPALVVNATRLGLDPRDPLPLDPLPAGAALLDLVYHPRETRWVRAARARGYRAADGGGMLVGQGAAAFQRWWGIPAPRGAMEAALREIRHEARTGVRSEHGRPGEGADRGEAGGARLHQEPGERRNLKSEVDQ